MDIKNAIEEAIGGKAILFTGAGFSKGAMNLEAEHMKSGIELPEYFCKKSGFPEQLELDEASEIYLENFGEDALVEDLKNKYTVKDISESQLIISSINWKRVYTTNYDNILEFCYSKIGKKITPVTLNDNIYDVDLKKPICVHLNGYIDRLNRNTLKNDFKLTNTSYLTEAFLSSKWLSLFRSDLSVSRAIFFVGYSLYDLDIKRILYQLKEIQEKCFFIIKARSSQALELRISKFGNIFSEGTEGFAAHIKEIASSYSVPEAQEIAFTSFDKFINPIDLSERFRDDDIFNLLLYGNKKVNYIFQSIQETGFPPYYIERDQINTIISGIKLGKRNFLIYSDLGNGKTLLLDGLKSRALLSNINVYSLTERNEYIYEELEYILKQKGDQFIIIEDYPNYIDIIEYINLNRSKNTALLLTCRTIVNDVFFERLEDALSHQDIEEYDINHLSNREIDKLVTLLTHYGVWGSRAALSYRKKKEYIQRDCKNEFQAVLLDIIKSPDIQDRLKGIFSELDKFPEYRKIITITFILELMGIQPRIYIIMQLLNTNAINSNNFRNNRIVKEFINFNRD